ncbi:hypothetical protein, partial [Bacteroides stercoris]|uniref:hypothetical protein n=1 Tax=Bacteroides stercoris TaxID=46506 RepID=UPI001C8C12B8
RGRAKKVRHYGEPFFLLDIPFPPEEPPKKWTNVKKYPIPYLTRLQEWDIQTKQTTRPSVTDSHCI